MSMKERVAISTTCPECGCLGAHFCTGKPAPERMDLDRIDRLALYDEGDDRFLPYENWRTVLSEIVWRDKRITELEGERNLLHSACEAMLSVLHQTNISKKKIANQARRALGIPETK